jgi:hypothetical protein
MSTTTAIDTVVNLIGQMARLQDGFDKAGPAGVMYASLLGYEYKGWMSEWEKRCKNA